MYMLGMRATKFRRFFKEKCLRSMVELTKMGFDQVVNDFEAIDFTPLFFESAEVTWLPQ